MIQLYVLMMTTYFTCFAAGGQPQLSGLQHPPRSTACPLRLFELPPGQRAARRLLEERSGLPPPAQPPDGPRHGTAQVHTTQNIPGGFSILQLSNADQSASSSYFCDVMLTEKIQGKCGNGTKLTVHDLKCRDCTTSDKIWWGWFLLLGYTIFVTTVIITFGIHHCHTKSKNKL